MSTQPKLIPLGDRVIVVPIKADTKKTKAGIYIPESANKEKPETGKVIAVGPGRWNEDGDERIPIGVKVGDTVIFSKYGPDEVKVEGEEYLIIREDSILAVIK